MEVSLLKALQDQKRGEGANSDKWLIVTVNKGMGHSIIWLKEPTEGLESACYEHGWTGGRGTRTDMLAANGKSRPERSPKPIAYSLKHGSWNSGINITFGHMLEIQNISHILSLGTQNLSFNKNSK